MERRLRRLRKLYAIKSQRMKKCLSDVFPDRCFTLEETALYFRTPLKREEAEALCRRAAEEGVRVRTRENRDGVFAALSFSGIPLQDIPEAAAALGRAWNR